MPTSPSEREKRIFLEAIKIEQQERRESFISQACGSDDPLRQRIDELVAAHERPESLLDLSPTQPIDATSDQPCPTEVPDASASIGPYHLRERIGEGGMGIVFVADQKVPLRRRVALKVIKPGLDTKSVIARFEAERQALALMDHPNIAKVLDAGTTEKGRPYFVMELVNGIAITTYCDQHRLTINERLELFETVCRAIQHAHRKGIIHRDIKPSNVLVTEQDGQAIPKVIDFGVAKAIGQGLTDRTIYTSFQAIIGTPLYMSPEQAALSNVDVDTRSDVYSLGVLLYELLTGATPFDRETLKNAAQDEVLRMIREQDPPRPSTKISTLGEKVTAILEGRRVDATGLGKAIRGDLDWIVMKTLEKDRSRRYESANDLAKDIERYLSHEPVEARAPSAVYRIQKFARRNRTKLQVGALAVVFLAICSAAGYRVYTLREDQRLADRVVQAHEDVGRAERLIDEKNYEGAFGLLDAAADTLPQDERIRDLLESICVPWRVSTTPQGGIVEVRPAGQSHQPWRLAGTTNLQFDNPSGLYHWRVSKNGMQTLEGMSGPGEVEIERKMVPSKKAPTGMALIVLEGDSGKPREVWFDTTEVTNKDFFVFLRDGGYQDEKYWDHLRPYAWNGDELEFSDLTKKLVDATGQSGPAGWKNGSFPQGESSLPVAGISWLEAAAYAKFRGKSLPTNADWLRAACLDQREQLAKFQVFGARSPVAVRESGAINRLGLYDMGGNVKEWCANTTDDGRRIVRGGAWNDHNYMFRQPEAYPSELRAKNIGFRCVKHVLPVPQDELQAVQFGPQAPVPLLEGYSPDEIANVKRRFDYDRKAALNAKVVGIKSTDAWRHETIELDAAYGDERFALHLFYPNEPESRTTPYQPLLFFPGLGVTNMQGIEKSGRWADLAIVVGLVQTGRVVCWPVYKGTLERTDGFRPKLSQHRKLEFVVQQTKDLSRAVDFMQQRPELDMNQITYIGWSRGGGLGSAFVVLEPRFRACVLMSGGLWTSSLRELDMRNYAPLVKVPTLLMNGRYDRGFEKSRIPLFNAIGSEDKQFNEYDSGHVMELEQAIEDIDQWLSARFSPSSGHKKTIAERLQYAKSLASGYLGESRFILAEAKYREVLQILDESESTDFQEVANATGKLAISIQRQGRTTEAKGLLETLLTKQQSIPGVSEEDLSKTRKAIEELRSETDN